MNKMDEIKRWTKIFIEEGHNITEARKKAQKKVSYIKECDNLKPEKNESSKNIYSN